MYGRTALSMSNGDADLSVGYCVSEGRPVGKYVDIGAMRTGCCTFPTIAFLSSQSKRDRILGCIELVNVGVKCTT